MKLLGVSVEGLFGTYNHTIKIKNDERITLILGENGLGKTAILKMIKCFFDQDFSELKTMNFTSFTLTFSSNQKIRLTKTQSKNKEPQLKIDKIGPRNKILGTFSPKQAIDRDRIKRYSYRTAHQANIFDDFYNESELEFIIKRFIPVHLHQIDPGVWYDPSKRRTLSSMEIIDRYRAFLPNDFMQKFATPEWLKKITSERKVRIVESQRLLNRIKSEDSKYKAAVVEYSQEIIEKIRTKRAEANDLSASLDRTYPQRLIDSLNKPKAISLNDLVKELSELETKRKILNNAGLIDTDENYIQPNINIKEQKIVSTVLQLYINDSNQKLNIYDDLSKRIILFQKIINNRFLHKRLTIDKQTGFNFTSTIQDANIIPLSGLSSGEQHELILFYQLLFNTEKGSLLLIDEPEISLHVTWQNQFINDLKSVIEANEMDIIIATHSPDIISNFWSLVTELDKNNIYK